MKLSFRLLAAALPLLLAACAHKEAVRPQADYTVLLDQQRAREHQLAKADHWVLQGKIGVSGQVNGKSDGGSGTLTWTQNGDSYEFVVRGPVGSKSFRLSVTPDGAVLDGLDGGPVRSPDAESLVEKALGWRVPLRDLRAWVLGLRADSGPAELKFGPDGLPATLTQDGWNVTYPAWNTTREPAVPNKVFAENPPNKVRLSVESWSFQ
ncbi:MAG TPA: lipoprotein insertase outer membrane protein LolB [Dyella sp.]|uniref:lipoprotein insertase outer membrane protein LolB n=1 Tax=Dyella sp. TaxID=1869338 RepID=UPI002D7A387A|nr:lipoprotein insertase outer membrane protein LolB [Dyella sp.]HET6553835.1 lipoprotein insertase outer membrane protein LolB [Dyella sp.]